MAENFEQLKIQESPSLVYNWSKTNSLGTQQQLHNISSEEELERVLKTTGTSKIKPVGTRLTYGPICTVDSNGLLLNMSALSGIISYFGDSVEVYGGTPLKTIFDFILSKGKMLPAAPGVIAIQTIAGAISTGTHGQGMTQATISDAVISLRVLTPAGQFRLIERSHPNFGAYMTSLGCLGIITRVTLRLIDNKIYRCMRYTTTFDDLADNFIDLNYQKEQAKAWWFPWTDEVQIWHIDQCTESELGFYKENLYQLTNLTQGNNKMENTINRLQEKLANETKDVERKNQSLETLRRFKVVSDVVGNVYQIMNKGIPAPQINCQIAIDIKYYKEVLLDLKAWHAKHQTSLHYPFILRFTGQSEAWLSNTYRQESFQLGFLVYLAEDGSFVKGSLELLREIQQILAKYGGRPHFGKHFTKELYDFDRILPKWTTFRKLMLEEDPFGRMRNQYIEDLFNLAKYPQITD